MAREITEIRVYWDSQDPTNEGWAYKAYSDEELIESGGIDAEDADIEQAIDEACSILDMDIDHQQFGIDKKLEGGFAVWNKED